MNLCGVGCECEAKSHDEVSYSMLDGAYMYMYVDASLPSPPSLSASLRRQPS